MAGLISVGRQYQQQSKQGMQRASDLQQAREKTEDNLDAQDKQATMSAVGAGAAIGGYMAAGSIGGPAGMAIGAGVGLLASQLF